LVGQGRDGENKITIGEKQVRWLLQAGREWLLFQTVTVLSEGEKTLPLADEI